MSARSARAMSKCVGGLPLMRTLTRPPVTLHFLGPKAKGLDDNGMPERESGQHDQLLRRKGQASYVHAIYPGRTLTCDEGPKRSGCAALKAGWDAQASAMADRRGRWSIGTCHRAAL